MVPTIRDIRVICTAPEGINLVVVKVETSEPGLYGLGCATLSYRHLTVQHLVETYIRPLVLGLPVNRISEIWQLVHQNAYWRSGPIMNNALSGVDMALWDIKGKMANMPVYDLLGGKLREGVAVYRHVDGVSADEICEKVEALRDIGVRHVRCQCGGYGGEGYAFAPSGAAKGSPSGVYRQNRRYMIDTLALFDKLRSKLGFEVELVHDVHERLHPTLARTFCKEMEPYRLFFLEDVVPTEELGWLNDIHSHTTTPLAQGELFSHPQEWRSLIQNRSIDYLRIHLSEIGGITPAWRLSLFAMEYGIRLCWHGPGDMSPVAHAANVHIDLAAPNFGLQEWSGTEPPNGILQELRGPRGALLDVFSGLPEYGGDGYVYANDKPGLGVDIDEKEAARYPCENTITTWTQTRSADGALQRP